MTLPIGTAEERELIKKIARALARSDGIPDNAPVGDYARNASDIYPVIATALQSRIAEVEALLERVGVLEGALKETQLFICDSFCGCSPDDPEHIEECDAARASLTQGGE